MKKKFNTFWNFITKRKECDSGN